MNDLKNVLKAIVIPYKDGATLLQIQKDYRDLEGRQLPCAQLGFASPRDLLGSLRDTIVPSQNRYGEDIYRARVDAETVHIHEMVRGQKAAPRKKKKRPLSSFGYGGYGTSRFNLKPSFSWGTPGWGKPVNSRPSQNTSQARIIPAGYERKVVGLNSRPLTNRPSSNSSQPQARIVSNVSVRRPTNNNVPTQLVSNRPPPGPANNARASASFLSAQDITNIKALLKKHGSDGINMGSFKMFYEKEYGFLDVKARGFSDLQHALSSIKHIVKVDLHPSRKHYMIKLVDDPSTKPLPSCNETTEPPNSPTNFPNTAISYFKGILNDHPYGISAANFLQEYENITGASMEPEIWGHFSLMEVFHSLPELFFVDPAEARSRKDDDDQDAIIYHADKVPPEVRQRVEAYHNKYRKLPQKDGQLSWSFKLKIMALLMNASDGIALDSFSTDFYLNFKESLDPCVYGFEGYKEMFTALSKELPLELITSYSGDDLSVQLTKDWQSKWIDLCLNNHQYDALKSLVSADNVVLPGDIIPEVEVRPDAVDVDVWQTIIMTSVVSPSCIFINLVDKYHSEALNDLMQRLTFYDRDSQRYAVPDYCLRENLICVAPFSLDNVWQRCRIVKVEPDRKKVRLTFIDFGGEQVIESNKIRLMKKEFSYLPSQAIRLSLRGIRSKTEKWSANAKVEVLSFMNRAVDKEQTLLCRFHTRKSSYVKATVKFEAEICAKTPLGYIFLHKQLIESGLAIPDETVTLPHGHEVLIPSNDVHRPIRRPMRVSTQKIIETLKNLKADNDTDQQCQKSLINGGTSTSTNQYNQNSSTMPNGNTLNHTNGNNDSNHSINGINNLGYKFNSLGISSSNQNN